jgi:hypothetical protein
VEEFVLHKVAITAEAVFDYEHCLLLRHYPADKCDTNWQKDSIYDLPLVVFPKQEIKAELEGYIQNHSKHKSQYYFRVRYLDDNFNQPLMFFIKRGERQSIMQHWFVVGICLADCWTEDDEEDGIIRAWYESCINDLPDTDWVEEARAKREREDRERLRDEKEQDRYERLFN